MTHDPHEPTDLTSTTRAVLKSQIEQLDRQIAQLSAQRNALTHIIESGLLQTFMDQVQAAVERSRPSLESVLLEVFQSSSRRLRTTDVVRAVVKERGVAVTPDEVHDNLNRLSHLFVERGKGWWSLMGDNQVDQGATCAGGSAG